MTSKYWGLVPIGIVVMYLAVKVVIRQVDLSRIEKDGVYAIGYLSQTDEVSNGVQYYFDYVYKGDTVHFMYKGGPNMFKLNDLYFFRILKDKPEVNQTMFDTPVPPCITLKSMPYDGWKTLPTCP